MYQLHQEAKHPSLEKLVIEGFQLEFLQNHVVVHNIPYLSKDRTLKYGSLVSEYTFLNHTLYFCGEMFHDIHGNPIECVKNSDIKIKIAESLQTDMLLSNKPLKGFKDYYEKFTNYIHLISGPALFLYPDSSIANYQAPEYATETVFKYPDTGKSIPGYEEHQSILENIRIGIIGVGGTGSYILDSIAKTRVKEIHLYDGDTFDFHNAYRAPGAYSYEKIKYTPYKADHFCEVYSNYRYGIFSHPQYVTPDNICELDMLDFVFISIDNGSSRKLIHEYLKMKKIPFIDSGIGMGINPTGIFGIARASIFCEANEFNPVATIDYSNEENDEYNSNLQIAEFNSLNADLAVLLFKKYYRCYSDTVDADSVNFTISEMETFLSGEKMENRIC